MNARHPLADSSGPVAYSLAFSDDRSLFTVALENGFAVFRSDRAERKTTRDFGAGIGYVDIVGTTNYLALVGGGITAKFSQNKVVLWDERKSLAATQLDFNTQVQRVRVTRTNIAVALLNKVYLYTFGAPPKLLSTYDTTNNPFGLCCLGRNLLVFPGRSPGHVQVVNVKTLNTTIVPAHSNPLRALELSPDEAIIATASEAGTLVRVWSAETCSKISELRRGIDPATIFSIAVSPSGNLLAVTSDKSTLHIFDLPHREPPPQPPSQPARPGLQPSPSTDSLEIVEGEEDSQPQSKWRWLANVPFAPRVFKDTYSFTSAHFEMGDEPRHYQQAPRNAGNSMTWNAPIPGIPGGRPPKGVIAWLDEDTLLVIGAGQDARWERFMIRLGDEGKRICIRDAWKRYLR